MRMLAALCAMMLIPAAVMDGPDVFPSDLEKWIVLDPPGRNSGDWLVANNDFEHEWVVTLRDGRPRVHLRDRKAEAPAPLPFEIEPGSASEGLYGKRLSTKVSDGWIVSFNAGEFGAGVWWFSPDGKKRYKISEAWIGSFIETDSGLLALEGIAHGTESKGRILRLARSTTGRWQSEDHVDLKHAPYVAVKGADGSLVVATTDRLLRVVPADRRVEVLLDDAFWKELYPNSIVLIPGGTFYLGMRHGVVKIEKKDMAYKVIWLLPNNEFADMKPKEGFK